MKFILMTNSTLDHNVVYELIKSGLYPQAIITDNPFYVRKSSFIKYIAKKTISIIKYLYNRQVVKNRFQPYFLAKKYSIPVYNSVNVNTEEFELKIKNMQIDYVFTFGFRILKENIIKAPKKGCINFHPAYLPFNRGATPSKWVLLNNQDNTGITFHYINKGIDEGEIIEQYKVSISGYESSEILNKYLFSLGSTLLVRLIYRIKNGEKITTTKNSLNLGSYERPFKKGDRVICDMHTCQEICNVILASRDGYNNALYTYNGKVLDIISFLLVENCLSKEELPFLDSDNNILINTSDDKQLILVTKKI